MPMRLELGALTVQVERQEDAVEFLHGLFRSLNNRELATLLGVSDKTVRRWKQEGRLPASPTGHISMLDLLHHAGPQPRPAALAPRSAQESELPAAPASADGGPGCA